MEQLTQEILRLCREYEKCRTEVERREEAQKVRNALGEVCVNARRNMDISKPGLLLALMEAYEVTRDEEMLQEVLDVVSGNLKRLPITTESVKLLAYCYYYVEEEECAELAKEMLEELKRTGEVGEDVIEAEKVVEFMIYEL